MFGLSALTLLFLVARSAEASHHNHNSVNGSSDQVKKWILNQPLSFQSAQRNGIIDARGDSTVMLQTEAVIGLYRENHERGGDKKADNEIVDAIGVLRDH